MKKFIMILIVTLLFVNLFSLDGNKNLTFNNFAQATAPVQDTWVLNWDVKAGSLDYTPGHVDAAPEFSCNVAHNGKVRHYQFRVRGYAALYVDGEFYNDSRKSRFVDAMYNSICNKLIYHR